MHLLPRLSHAFSMFDRNPVPRFHGDNSADPLLVIVHPAPRFRNSPAWIPYGKFTQGGSLAEILATGDCVAQVLVVAPCGPVPGPRIAPDLTRCISHEQASKPAKQPKKATGQKMLLPIEGKKPEKEAVAKKSAARGQRKSA
jgi:hypothetical protein